MAINIKDEGPTRREFLRNSALAAAGAVVAAGLKGDLRPGLSAITGVDVGYAKEKPEVILDGARMSTIQIDIEGKERSIPAVIINPERMKLLESENPSLVITLNSSDSDHHSIATFSTSNPEEIVSLSSWGGRKDPLSKGLAIAVTDERSLAKYLKDQGYPVLFPENDERVGGEETIAIEVHSGKSRFVRNKKDGDLMLSPQSTLLTRFTEVRQLDKFIYDNQLEAVRTLNYAEKEFVGLGDLGIQGENLSARLEVLGYKPLLTVVSSQGKNFPGLGVEVEQGDHFYLKGSEGEKYDGPSFSVNTYLAMVPNRDSGSNMYVVIQTDNSTYSYSPAETANTLPTRVREFNPEHVELRMGGEDGNLLLSLDHEQVKQWEAQG